MYLARFFYVFFLKSDFWVAPLMDGTNSSLKILHLVIHTSNVSVYDEMYMQLSSFYSRYKNVDTFFIEFKADLDKKFVFQGDKLIIRGEESLVPGLLWKTLDSMLIMLSKEHNYSYIVRSNISTLINFDRFIPLITNTPCVNYLAGNLMKLEWLDVQSGIVDKRWFGTLFAQGTFICMSIGFVNKLLELRHKIRNNIIDDVSLGIFYKENFNNPVFHHLNNRFVSISDTLLDNVQLQLIDNQKSPIAWRNKSLDRTIDIFNLNKIAEFISRG